LSRKRRYFSRCLAIFCFKQLTISKKTATTTATKTILFSLSP